MTSLLLGSVRVTCPTLKRKRVLRYFLMSSVEEADELSKFVPS